VEKRVFDIVISLVGIILLFPFFIILSLWIKLDSKGPVFFTQVRVGRNNKDFRLFKFRTMRMGSEKMGLLTVGGRDPRVTNSGYFIRKYKLDEFPQLFNVLLGDMSIVGPRPEVRKYVDMYSEQQKMVLLAKPGISDYASIQYSNENEILANAKDPESEYINVIMPEKLRLNQKYIDEQGLLTDLKIIGMTLQKVFLKR
jgi:lipopolysaccharide/colanic/teichoic acid biosynthesis glycosyltransferase